MAPEHGAEFMADSQGEPIAFTNSPDALANTLRMVCSRFAGVVSDSDMLCSWSVVVETFGDGVSVEALMALMAPQELDSKRRKMSEASSMLSVASCLASAFQ